MLISAVGVPPKWVVEKLHAHNILVCNMIGSPKHVQKALDVGVDGLICQVRQPASCWSLLRLPTGTWHLVCLQGTEAGGHTGDVATLPLVPQCVDIAKGQVSPLHGGPIAVIAAGGIFDGRGVAAALSLGAQAVWVGTRFVATEEAGAGMMHKNGIVASDSDGTIRTLIFSGRPMRVHKSEYVMDWELNRRDERDGILRAGQRPYKADLVANEEKGTPISFARTYPQIFGQACGGIKSVPPAGDVVRSMMAEAVAALKLNQTFLVAKL